MTTESLSVTIEGEVLTVEIGTVAASAGGGGSSDHGTLTGLADDDHTQYALADGSRGTFEASGAVATHAGATDPHGDRAFATSAVSTHAALTTGAHGITAAGAALLDDATAADQRTTLGLGTAATQATGAFEAAGAVSTHNAVTTAHGISAFGATLVDDADAATARTTLGLGTAATSATGDFAAASHAHAASAITSGTLVHERGGLEADVSAYSGLVKIAAGATSAVTVTAAGEALLDDADASAQRTTLGLTALATTTPAAGVATFLATPSSANLAAAVTDETGSGALVFATSPTLVTPALGTPSSGTLTNCTGLPPAALTQSGASSSDVLAWNGGAWVPTAPSAGGAPGGSDSELQYRGGPSTFSGATGTHWDSTNGRLSIGAGTSPAGVLHVACDSASEIPAIFQGAASQTANSQEWRNSAATVLGAIDSLGNLVIGSSTYNSGSKMTAGTRGIDLRTADINAAVGISLVRSDGATGMTIRHNGNSWITTFQDLYSSGRIVFLSQNGRGFTLIGGNLEFDTSTGIKLGTATTQKIGFWNATPVVQPAGANQAAVSDTAGATYTSAEQTMLANLKTLVNQLRADLVSAGIIKGSA